jgi:hypothetical protein
MNTARTLISKLSLRFNNENDLSDLVWTLCELSDDFQGLFLSFFFPELKAKHVGLEVQREFSKNNSRPDFYFLVGEKEYLIEVKLYDTNDHYEQYVRDFPDAQRGWIAIYQANPHDKFKIKTWREFHTFLANELNSISDSTTLEIVRGFSEYLKSVCSIINFEKMNLSGFQSLYFFNKSLPELIQKKRPNIRTSINAQPKSYSENMSGNFFYLEKEKKTQTLIPWFGIYYDEKNTVICVAFSTGWCKSVFLALKSNAREGKYFVKPYDEDNSYWFELKEEEHQKLNEMNSYDDQKDLLDAFLTEVLEEVYVYL